MDSGAFTQAFAEAKERRAAEIETQGGWAFPETNREEENMHENVNDQRRLIDASYQRANATIRRKTVPVQRFDEYHIYVNGIVVYATPEQEARIRALTDEQRARFLKALRLDPDDIVEDGVYIDEITDFEVSAEVDWDGNVIRASNKTKPKPSDPPPHKVRMGKNGQPKEVRHLGSVNLLVEKVKAAQKYPCASERCGFHIRQNDFYAKVWSGRSMISQGKPVPLTEKYHWNCLPQGAMALAVPVFPEFFDHPLAEDDIFDTDEYGKSIG